MKKISIVIPAFNEEENIANISDAIVNELENLNSYDYEIIIIDNYSTDNTRKIIEKKCSENKKIKAIFNCKNFGQFNSPYYALLQSTGDCTMLICADFQDPVELIPKFIEEWENGYKIVIGVKESSKESRMMYFLRSCYYKIIKKFSDIEQIEHFTGFGLYDKDFINILRNLNDTTPYLRGIVAELGFQRKEIKYKQPKRIAGKTHNNFYTLYDAAMLGFTSYTKIGLRWQLLCGMFVGGVSVIIGIIYLILKILYWDRFAAGMAPILIGMFFLGALQLFFIGFMGEYILSINHRLMKRPLVIEERRINFK